MNNATLNDVVQSYRDIAQRYADLDTAIRKGHIDLPSATSRYAHIRKDGTLGISNLDSARPEKADDRTGAIPFIVTVFEEDRDGDTVNPQGYYGENYKRNPVWFWGHQQNPIPIGTSRIPGTRDKVAVEVHPKYIRSTCYFDLPDPNAHFLYEKVKRGMLNSTSIAFVPIEAYRKDAREKAQTHGGRSLLPAGWYFNKFDHTETSLVGIGANPGAVRDWIDREKSFLTPQFCKSLGYYAAEARQSWNGWAPPCPPGFSECNGICVPSTPIREKCMCEKSNDADLGMDDDDVELTDKDDEASPDLELEVEYVKAKLGQQLLKYGPDLRGMMQTHGLTPSAVNELEKLRLDHVHRAAQSLAGRDGGEINDAQLADMLGIPEDDAKKYLDLLVEQGLVDNKVSPRLAGELSEVKRLIDKVQLKRAMQEVKALTQVVVAQRRR